ncbi:MAG: phosphatase PAP2 family protein [Lysobacterales bacterium]
MQTEDKTVLRRILSYPIEKSVGPTIAITTFFVAYFYVLNNPYFTAQLMPVLPIDHWVPVISWTAWVYFSLWVFICFPQALMGDRRVMLYYLGGAFLLSIIGLSIFFFYPTAVPVWEIDWSRYPSLEFLKSSDRAGNACPSLHVSFAAFSGCWLVWLIRRLNLSPVWGVLSILWGLAIIVSTMTTKQHVLIDVIFGLLLGVLVFWINVSFAKKARLEI